MSDETSFYNTAPPPPVNPFDVIGKYQGIQGTQIQNQLLQQHLQQQQIATQKIQGQQRIAQIIDQNTQDGKVNWLGVKSAAAKDPLAAMNYDQVEAIADPQLAATNFGVTSQGAPQVASLQNVQQKLGATGEQPPSGGGSPKAPIQPSETPNQESNNQPDENSSSGGPPTMATGTPQGFTTPLDKSRANYNEVADTAKGAPTMNAAYNEAINLVNSGAPTGTKLADWYQFAAKNDPFHVLTGKGTTDKAVQTQELGKWIAQGLLANGMPGSDARLAELQHANLNQDQLAETVKELAPFFKAVSQGAIAKQQYYNKVTDNGTNLATEPHANQRWNENYDPRWIEFDALKGKDAQHEFLVKHPDLIESQQKYKNLKNMGVVGQ